MTTGYSTLTRKDIVREIKTIRKTADKISALPNGPRKFLIRAGILSKDGTQVAAKYRK